MSLSWKPPVGAKLNANHALSKGLVGCWLMNEGGGGAILTDLTQIQNGSLVNAPTWVAGKSGVALNFASASTQYVDIGTKFAPLGGTLTAWVKAASFPGGYNAVVNKNVSTTATFFILIKSTGKMACYVRQADSTALSYDGTGTNTLVAGTWYFLAFSYSSARGGVGYVNGKVDGTFAAGTDLNTTTGNMRIGSDPEVAGREWNGLIDNVRIYNRVLTQNEVQRLYTEPYAGLGLPKKRSWKSSAGIAFDAAGNSGDQAAASSYSGSVTWNGTNRMLAIDVSMLGAGVTVTAMTYGGANCTLVGVQSTVTSFGRVEQWRICSSDAGAPAAGANTLSITLSGSLEFSAEWTSYTGVHQTSPTEGFNSNQATNAGSATDATVTVTTVADNCWVHAAVVANDTSITAGQTSRNNISGTLGSGGNEDNNAPKTPAGTVAMSYTGMGITTTWAIAGYAIRPIAASGLAALYRFFFGA